MKLISYVNDFNAKVRNESVKDIVEDYSLEMRNEQGDKWTEMHSMIIGNTWFKQHLRRVVTWSSPDKKVFN